MLIGRISNANSKDENSFNLAIVDSIHKALAEIRFEYGDISVQIKKSLFTLCGI